MEKFCLFQDPPSYPSAPSFFPGGSHVNDTKGGREEGGRGAGPVRGIRGKDRSGRGRWYGSSSTSLVSVFPPAAAAAAAASNTLVQGPPHPAHILRHTRKGTRKGRGPPHRLTARSFASSFISQAVGNERVPLSKGGGGGSEVGVSSGGEGLIIITIFVGGCMHTAENERVNGGGKGKEPPTTDRRA